MITGILKEPPGENRIAIMPDHIKELVKVNVRILVEKGAGNRAAARDEEYAQAGATLESRKQILEHADILVMINPLDHEEIKTLRETQVVLGAFNPLINHDLVRDLAARSITSFSLDVVPRVTRAQAIDVLSSQASVSGYKAVLDAAGRFGGFMNMFMSAAGTIKPAKVLVLGAGVAGLQAIATARKLGAVVEAFDVRAASKTEVMSLGAKFVEVEGAVDQASAGGYAVEQTDEFKTKQRQVIQDHAVRSDIIICTAQIPGRKAPVLILKDTVEMMAAGSVIIDIAASTGGNCELTRDNEVVIHNDIQIVGKSNYPSDMPADASLMFSKNMITFLSLLINNKGELMLDSDDEIVKGTCVTKNGNIVHSRVSEFINNK